ncbi:MAG: urease accessory protein UreD [Myxococcaceae bacterium]
MFQRSERRTVLSQAFARSPLRVLTPRNHGHGSWAYLSSLGGGMVDGDRVDLSVAVEANACAFLSTQGPTRVYRSPRGCRNVLRARVDDGALFAWVPDPLALFAGARLEQSTEIELHPGASLVFVDVLTAGRIAFGERWAFGRLDSTLRVRRERKLIHERLLLDPDAGPIPARMGRFDAFATVLLAGPLLRAAAEAWGERVRGVPLRPGAELVIAPSLIEHDVWLFRVAGISVERVSHAIRDALGFLPGLLGDNPFERRA